MEKLFKALTGKKATMVLSILIVLVIFLGVAAFGIWMFKLILWMLGVI